MEEKESRTKLEELCGSIRVMLSTLGEMETDIGAPAGKTDIVEELPIFYAYVKRAKELCPQNGDIQRLAVRERSSVLLGEFRIMARGLYDMLKWELEKGS